MLRILLTYIAIVAGPGLIIGLGFIIRDIYSKLTEPVEVKIRRTVAERKRQAEEREIAPKVSFVLDTLGLEEVQDAEGSICLRRLKDKIQIDFSGATVFQATCIPEWTYSFKRKVLEPDSAGRGLEIKSRTDSVTYPSRYEIEAYDPGQWELRLEALRSVAAVRYRQVEIERARLAKEKERSEAEALRKRFGI